MYFAFVLQNLSGPVAEYARGMEAGLRKLGHRAAVVQGAAALPPGARPVLDGRLFPALEAERDVLLARGAAALFHDPGVLVAGGGPERTALSAALREWLPRLGRIVATNAPAADRLAAEADIEGGRLALIPPGVAEAARSAGSGGPGCAVLTVGDPAPETGHDALLRALSKLPDLDWALTVAGGTPDLLQPLREQARELGIAERVHFHADPDPAALEALWGSADVFALAARPGGCVGAVTEAIRRGVPVATTEGVAGAGVPPGAGTATPVDDAPALSKCLRRLIFDAPMRRAMAETAWLAGQALPTWPTQAALLAAHLG